LATNGFEKKLNFLPPIERIFLFSKCRACNLLTIQITIEFLISDYVTDIPANVKLGEARI